MIGCHPAWELAGVFSDPHHDWWEVELFESITGEVGQVTDALLAVLGSSWSNCKMVIAVDPDIDIYDYRDVHYALATRVDPTRHVIHHPQRPRLSLRSHSKTYPGGLSRCWREPFSQSRWEVGDRCHQAGSLSGSSAKGFRTCLADRLDEH
ncbi:MAG: UbiD family decarboxylase [Acidobacteria bacterium]|nr:UbiD family decarboxylase [Acidobacteriota bacterium]